MNCIMNSADMNRIVVVQPSTTWPFTRCTSRLYTANRNADTLPINPRPDIQRSGRDELNTIRRSRSLAPASKVRGVIARPAVCRA